MYDTRLRFCEGGHGTWLGSRRLDLMYPSDISKRSSVAFSSVSHGLHETNAETGEWISMRGAPRETDAETVEGKSVRSAIHIGELGLNRSSSSGWPT